MKEVEFQDFAEGARWRFAKSIPNWPHFYIVEKEMEDGDAFVGARCFIEESGYDGKFFDMDVRYFDTGGWTYWASPLNKSLGSRYMLNRCKTEFTYTALAEQGELPPEGFAGAPLSLEPVLEDPLFLELLRDATGGEFSVFDVLGTADYEIRHSNVLAWLLDQGSNHGQGSRYLELLWRLIAAEHDLPELGFGRYSVTREGEGEDEKVDLLLRSDDGAWMIVVENKLFSPETGDQLDRYYRYVEARYGNIPNRVYVYLTPDGIAPATEADSEKWLPASYAVVREALLAFVKSPLPERVAGFLEQYLEHIDRNVLKGTPAIEKQRRLLGRHAKTLHALEHMLEDEDVLAQCSGAELAMLKSTLAVQHEVGRELFEFTKQMMTKHGIPRYSGLGHWLTIEPPGLKERLVGCGMMDPTDSMPVLLSLSSEADTYVAEAYIYKNKPIFNRTSGRLPYLSDERPRRNRGDEHLVEVLFARTIIGSDDIIARGLDDLKAMIAAYFEEGLEGDLRRTSEEIGDAIEAVGRKTT